ncbi:MAG TPA: hypothetical protein VIW24_25735 [Aldersonia sp.]
MHHALHSAHVLLATRREFSATLPPEQSARFERWQAQLDRETDAEQAPTRRRST